MNAKNAGDTPTPPPRARRAVASCALLGALALGCTRPGGPGVTNEFGDAGIGFAAGARCVPVVSAEPVPPRSEITTPGLVASSGNVYFTSQLFGTFNTICGTCHVAGNSGGLTVTESSFPQLITQAVIDDRIKQDDANVYMPPAGSLDGEPYSQRAPNDPLVQFVALLEIWIDQGSPAQSFLLNPAEGGSGDGGAADGGAADGGSDAATTSAAAQADYTISPELGAQLTNIGSCLPNKYAVGVNTATMDKLDAQFASATALPPTLAETDVTTFDSDTLARNGVISYYPAYPLWSDNASKMRYVRPPRGQSIVFDKATQQFQIPPNTRFYKTFLKPVIDVNGNPAFKKIETRLIVSRPDTTLSDGTIQQNAIFGTYVWNEDETEADLLQDPLRDGLPFADRVITYITDEPRANAIIATKPPNVDYVLDNENPGLVRHYALPGSTRCMQCHMGSPSASFILGFTPLQVATAPAGTNGVIEAATADELTQLQRLIDYKIITGISSAADVTPLQNSQLPRAPRNAYELKAQAYMVGNCAHCHNPRGFPSTKAPALKDVLDFLPGPNGGIFQFSLQTTSPVRSRGANQDVPVPYITPSLRDYLDPTEIDGVQAYTDASVYRPKYVPCSNAAPAGWCEDSEAVDFLDAPWRALVYRNVDTPFDYVDDLVIFPHMPMNTPGYDCRVPQIMGDWMVSIPAIRVDTNKTQTEDSIDADTVDDTPQPYAEVMPGDSGYAAAATAAQARLATYHAGRRYNFCPDTTDIIDPSVLDGDNQVPPDAAIFNLAVSPPPMIMPAEGVPNRASWVATDTTDPPGDWVPRGTQWPTALEQGQAVVTRAGAEQQLQSVVDQLEDVVLDDATRTALTTPIPYALWQQNPDCAFTGVPEAGSFQGADRPAWMRSVADANAPVLSQSPGAAVFTNICINCHGPLGDAQGLLADEISIMTGGNARVANFQAGLFGPVGLPGENRQRVFGGATPPPGAIPTNPTPDDFGARYMAWMANGGTQQIIPQALLTVVASTSVAGARRTNLTTLASPNMLQLVQELCGHLAPDSLPIELPDDFYAGGGASALPFRGLIQADQTPTNGDIDVYLKLCSLNNRPIVRVVIPDSSDLTWANAKGAQITSGQLYWGAAAAGSTDGGAGGGPYPPDAPVMDQRGHVVNGITPDNLFPICIRQPLPSDQAAADAWIQAHLVQTPEPNGPANPIPYCPPDLFATGIDPTTGQSLDTWALVPESDADGNFGDVDRWAIRGAINGGLAVFLYVDGMSKGAQPQPLYNQCEQLTQ